MSESTAVKIIAEVIASGYTEILLLDGASESEDGVLVLSRTIAKHTDAQDARIVELEETIKCLRVMLEEIKNIAESQSDADFTWTYEIGCGVCNEAAKGEEFCQHSHESIYEGWRNCQKCGQQFWNKYSG